MTQFSNEKYNLEERTARFGEEIIRFCKLVAQDVISKPIIAQLIRSATSIGANYCEANCASSKKDFANKIFICKKEAQETRHWLRMVANCAGDMNLELAILNDECQQLIFIFQKITNSLRNKIENSKIE